jgi:hypothetical protein
LGHKLFERLENVARQRTMQVVKDEKAKEGAHDEVPKLVELVIMKIFMLKQ